VPGARERIEADLRWLGLDWDEGPYVQSERGALYDQAIATLAARGLVYPCDCSRAEISRVASAPHEGEDVVYPGTCRERDRARPMKRSPSWRVRVPDEVVGCEDAADVSPQNLAREVGDFVLRRADGVYAYQLAVVVDDLDMRVTHVVRGADLRSSTPRQIWLARALGGRPPTYMHVPLVLAPDGSRLQKRLREGVVRDLRDAGVSARQIVGELAHGLGLTATSKPASAAEVAEACAGREIAWRREPWRLPIALAAAGLRGRGEGGA